MRVVVADTNPRELVAASADADAFVQVPAVRDARFSEVFNDAAVRSEVDTWVPVHDLEVIAAAEARDRGGLPPGIVTTAPALEAARLCWDKLRVSAVLVDSGLPTPRTVRSDVSGWRGPCVVKPRNGVGSRGMRLLDSPSLRTSEEASAAFLLQEPCVGPEVTIDAFRSARDGWFAATCRERLDVRAGIATRCRVFADERLSSLAEDVAKAIGLTGTFCMQVMRSVDRDGWLVTDVNPRPGGATRMSVAAGMDYHSALLADVWGDDPRPYLPGLVGERWVARGYVERVLAPGTPP
jgi:biotin carboxylase